MGRKEQLRFYKASELFNDDERIMAFAICHFLKRDFDPLTIYKDLLNCKYSRWLDDIDLILDTVTHTVLVEWCAQKEFELDMACDLIWSIGDNKMLEFRGWKLGKNDEVDE